YNRQKHFGYDDRVCVSQYVGQIILVLFSG
ncbi:unnamed protein product, partial [marine sediment metagenome]